MFGATNSPLFYLYSEKYRKFAENVQVDIMLENEKGLINSVANGDEAAFEVVFYYYYPKVRVFLTDLLKDRAAAEDLAQEVFAKIWLMRSALPEIRSFGSYLYTMTRNSALFHIKKDRLSVTMEDIDLVEEEVIESRLTAEEKERRIKEIVGNMPERRRLVFTLSRDEGKSNEEIAEILGIKKKTVENLMNAALKDIRRILCLMIFF